MHDIDHDLAPQNLKNLFTRLASIHSYNTRAVAAGKFHVIHSRTKQQNQSFSWLGARICHKIPELFNQNQNNYSKNTFRLNCCSFSARGHFMT